MKNLTAKTIQTMIALVVFVVSATSFATEPLPYALFQGDDVLNLHQFGKYLEERFDEMDNERSNAKYDMRRMVDRNNIDNAHPMRILQAIGKVTKPQGPEDTRDFQKDPKSFENKSWSTGTMISPYHMITNKHAVCNRELRADGKKRCIKTENLIGKEIHFSFGEKKDGSDFDKRVTGKVIASNSREDVAIVRIDSLKDVKDVPYVRPNFSAQDFQNLNDNVCLGAGFPIQSKNESNHKIYAITSVPTLIEEIQLVSENLDAVVGVYVGK
jgi:hypothetical protein